MAKKVVKKRIKVNRSGLSDKMLPQNIIQLGERVDQNKNIYIYQPVYKEIHKFTKNKTENESGGVLVGHVLEEFGKTNIVITGFIEAKYSEGTPTTLTFTHESWDYIHEEMDKKFPKKKIVGWIHTHPDFGIFLSEYDKFIHENFFSDEHQIAYVVDPIQQIEGFYFWVNSNLERCKGFYVFDKTDVEIDVEKVKEKEAASKKTAGSSGINGVITGFLAVLVIILMIMLLSLNKSVTELTAKCAELEQNLALIGMQASNNSSSANNANTEINNIKEFIDYVEPTQPPTEAQTEAQTKVPSDAPTDAQTQQ